MSEKPGEPAPSRRELFRLGVAAVGAAVAGFVASTLRYLVPNVLYEPSARFTAGHPDEYPAGSTTFLEDRRLFIVNGSDGFYSISSVCTHHGCNVKRTGAGFQCPCHGSRFDDHGRVVQGPAPAPLRWYALTRSPRGQLIVDLDRPVGPEFRLKV
jgi:cytochrome b6-f complex iron-sulfur subunit